MDGKRAMLVIIAESHLWRIKAGLPFYKIANSSILYDHARPEGVAREAEEIRAGIGQYLDHNIGPAGKNVGGLDNLAVGQSGGDDLI